MPTPDSYRDTKSYAVNPDSYRDGQPLQNRNLDCKTANAKLHKLIHLSQYHL